MAISFDNAKLRLIFTLSVIQNRYPYFEDHGFGFLDFRFTLLVRFDGGMSEECPHCFHMTKHDDNFRIHLLKLEINSDNSFLYESIMSLLQSVALTALEALHDELTDQIFNELNDSFTYNFGILDPITKSNVVQDLRYTDKIRVYDQFATMTFAGYYCTKEPERVCKGNYFENKSIQLPQIASNYDFQVYHHLYAIRSWFSIVFDNVEQEFQDLQLRDIQILKPIEVVRFVNTGAVARFAVAVDGASYEFEALLRVSTRMLYSDGLEMLQVMFNLQALLNGGDQELKEIGQEVLDLY